MALAKIIGLSGTNGSGKDTVGEMLAAQHGYLFVSVSDLLREEARRRNLPVTREVLRTISAEWRREFGLGVLVDRAIEKCKSFGDKYVGVVASPMRNAGEAQHLKDCGGLLIWVDADPRVRYERITNRKRSLEDDKTFEQFLAEEQDEMHRQVGADEATLNMAAVKEKADIFLENNGSDVAVFQSQIEKVLNRS
jgi:dephospho-CoA kinase